jgi:hypothetical protein
VIRQQVVVAQSLIMIDDPITTTVDCSSTIDHIVIINPMMIGPRVIIVEYIAVVMLIGIISRNI